jgi:hypothetical protein
MKRPPFTTVTVEITPLFCAGCGVFSAPIVHEARSASDMGRADGAPGRLIATRLSTPLGWGRFTFQDGEGDNAKGDLCAECVPKVRAELRRVAGQGSFAE